MSTLLLTAPASTGEWFDAEADLALADRVAALPDDVRAEVLAEGSGLDPDELLHDFRFWGRPSQLAVYDSQAYITAVLSGRGFGKTMTISHVAHRMARRYPGSRGALVARTTADVRGTMVLGESGIANTCLPDDKPRYVPNNRELTWPNGTVAQTFSAMNPDLLRGPQFHWAVCDEVAAWPTRPPAGSIANAWDNVKLATRLGDSPQIFAATTPRRVPVVVEILNGAHGEPSRYRVVRGSTMANRHLPQVYRQTIFGMYAGTDLARQELEGELLGDVEGALLTLERIPRLPINADGTPESFNPMSFPFRIIGVDPTVADAPRDECGIVVIAVTGERDVYSRTAYVVADESVHGSPDTWSKRVATLARRYQAYVVAEDNQGGELVRTVIRQQDPQVPVALARSRESKAVRAEPVVLAYEQHRVIHSDFFGELESQLTTWVPDESTYSPDRLDALVVACSAALVNPPRGMGGRVRLASRREEPAAARTVPGARSNLRSPSSTPEQNMYKPRPRVHFAGAGGAAAWIRGRAERKAARRRARARRRRR